LRLLCDKQLHALEEEGLLLLEQFLMLLLEQFLLQLQLQLLHLLQLIRRYARNLYRLQKLCEVVRVCILLLREHSGFLLCLPVKLLLELGLLLLMLLLRLLLSQLLEQQQLLLHLHLFVALSQV
jgi:hypothetical protein